MIPKILGIGSAVLAAGFILALPSIFVAEPAGEVEPIRFGPPPLLGLAEAEPVEEPRPSRSAPGLSLPATASAPLPFAPVAAPGGESPSGIGSGGGDSQLQPALGEIGGGDEADGDDDDADRRDDDAGDDDAGSNNEASGEDDDVESWDDDVESWDDDGDEDEDDEEEDGDDDEEDEGED